MPQTILHMLYIVSRLRRDEKATASIEYAILLGLIAVAVIGLVAAVGNWVSLQWDTLNAQLP